jgi:hypothetical protein
MPYHQERPATALAHGPAKRDDIERARRQIGRAEEQLASDQVGVFRAVRDMEAACQTIREDLDELKRSIAIGGAAMNPQSRTRRPGRHP